MSKREHPHLEVNEISDKAKASMKTRVIVAFVAAVLVIPALILGGWVLFAIAAIAIALAVYEMIHAAGKKYPWYVWAFTYILVFSYVYWFVLKGNFLEWQKCQDVNKEFHFSLENYYSGISVSPISIGVGLGFYCLATVTNEEFGIDDVAYFIFFTLLLGFGFQCFLLLRYYPFYMFSHNAVYSSNVYAGTIGSELLNRWDFRYFWSFGLFGMMLVSATFTDTFAYFGGSLFGKHKMNPRISPNKTWEGFFIGIFFGILGTFLLGLLMAINGCPVLPTLTSDKWYRILLVSVVAVFSGVLGDLSFSAIKRHYGVKDYGTIMPGHGGVLDRIDSNLFATIGMAILLVFITNGWNFAL